MNSWTIEFVGQTDKECTVPKKNANGPICSQAIHLHFYYIDVFIKCLCLGG